ncbi:hypothetical protein KI387_014971, partial [Taxus chinensis]
DRCRLRRTGSGYCGKLGMPQDELWISLVIVQRTLVGRNEVLGGLGGIWRDFNG